MVETIEISVFGRLRDFIPEGKVLWETDVNPHVGVVRDYLRQLIESNHPGMGAIVDSCAFADETTILRDSDHAKPVMAVLPPVCGG